MTPIQQAAADLAISNRRKFEELMRAQRRSWQPHRVIQMDSLDDGMIAVFNSLTNEDAKVVSQAINEAIPDRWFEIPNALPPEERAEMLPKLTGRPYHE